MFNFFPFETKRCYRLNGEQTYYEQQLKRNLFLRNYDGEICSWGFNLTHHHTLYWSFFHFFYNCYGPNVSGVFVKHAKQLYFVTNIYLNAITKFLLGFFIVFSIIFLLAWINNTEEVPIYGFLVPLFYAIIMRVLLFYFYDIRIIRSIEFALDLPELCGYQEIKQKGKEAQSS